MLLALRPKILESLWIIKLHWQLKFVDDEFYDDKKYLIGMPEIAA